MRQRAGDTEADSQSQFSMSQVLGEEELSEELSLQRLLKRKFPQIKMEVMKLVDGSRVKVFDQRFHLSQSTVVGNVLEC